MTKIKNTKKGMAKKTLSISLVAAMLATSNVPVWATEFSDGSDVTFTSEAPAEVVEEVVTEAPVVEAPAEVEVAAEPVVKGSGYDIAAPGFTLADGSLANDSVVWWGNTVSTTVTVSEKADITVDAKNADIKYVWKANGREIAAPTTINKDTATAVSLQLNAGLTNSKVSLFVYAQAKNDGTIVWSWESDSFTVKPVDITKEVNVDGAPSLAIKEGFATTYTGKAIVPTIDDIVFTAGNNNNYGFTKGDFVIGSTEGDTVNVTDDGVTVYMSVQKTGFTGSIKLPYKILK